MDLFPDIGLDKTKFRVRKCTFTSLFFSSFSFLLFLFFFFFFYFFFYKLHEQFHKKSPFSRKEILRYRSRCPDKAKSKKEQKHILFSRFGLPTISWHIPFSRFGLSIISWHILFSRFGLPIISWHIFARAIRTNGYFSCMGLCGKSKEIFRKIRFCPWL
jgi:hypothetical protein